MAVFPFDGGFAFFHRFPDRSIDEADITSRTLILADFIEAASTQYDQPGGEISRPKYGVNSRHRPTWCAAREPSTFWPAILRFPSHPILP